MAAQLLEWTPALGRMGWTERDGLSSEIKAECPSGFGSLTVSKEHFFFFPLFSSFSSNFFPISEKRGWQGYPGHSKASDLTSTEFPTGSRKEISTLPRDTSPGLKLDSRRGPGLQAQGGCFEQVSLPTTVQTRDQTVLRAGRPTPWRDCHRSLRAARPRWSPQGQEEAEGTPRFFLSSPGKLCTTYLLTKGAGCGSRNSQGPESEWGGTLSPITPSGASPTPRAQAGALLRTPRRTGLRPRPPP